MKTMTRIEVENGLAEIIERTTKMEAQIARLLGETSGPINENREGRSSKT